MNSNRRIFVSGIFQETHSFSTLLTKKENFAVTMGDELMDQGRHANSILGGGFRVLEQAGVKIIPGINAVATPGGPVSDVAYEEFRSQIVKAAKEAQPDGIFIAFHGAMGTESLPDAEGDLLQMLRSELGSNVRIATALDLHANVTPQMLANADICLACKKNPHSDYADAGAKAAELLLLALDDKINPVTAAVWTPLITGHRLETAEGPLSEVHELRKKAITMQPQILDISICNTQTYLDAEGAGQCVTVITNGESNTGKSLSVSLSEALWERRYEFETNSLPLDEALFAASRAPQEKRPFVMGDLGNRVLAGAPGDGTHILTKIKNEWPTLRSVVPVTDPDAVQIAKSAGVGNTVSMTIGGKFSIGETPLKADWRVVRLGDGKFIQDGPFLAGELAESGETAVLECDNITVIATSQPCFSQDTAAFTSNGVDPRQYDVVVVSSGYHFKLSFANIGTSIIVNTSGITNYQPGQFPFRHRGPCFPEVDIKHPDLNPRIFHRGREVGVFEK